MAPRRKASEASTPLRNMDDLAEQLAALTLRLEVAEMTEARHVIADRLRLLRDGLPAALDGIPPAVREALLHRREQEAGQARGPRAPMRPLVAPAVAGEAAPATYLENCILVLYDFETTGLNATHDHIVQIAAQALRCFHGTWVRDGPELNLLVDPGVPIPADATAIHGITDADVAGAVDPIAGLRQLREYITRQTPTIAMAHNGMRFDRHFVRNTWQPAAHGPFDPSNVRCWGDSISLYKLLSPGRFDSYKLGNLYEALDGPTGLQAHQALGDVRMMEHVLGELWAERDRGFDSSLGYLDEVNKSTAPAGANLRNRTLFPLIDDRCAAAPA